MKNLFAVSAGALVHLTLLRPDFASHPQPAATRTHSTHSTHSTHPQRQRQRADVRILHLTSYERMGIARVHCVSGCVCIPQELDAHRPPSRRNVSIFRDGLIQVDFTTARCEMALRLLHRTSSGQHKWVLTRVTVSPRV